VHNIMKNKQQSKRTALTLLMSWRQTRDLCWVVLRTFHSKTFRPFHNWLFRVAKKSWPFVFGLHI